MHLIKALLPKELRNVIKKAQPRIKKKKKKTHTHTHNPHIYGAHYLIKKRSLNLKKKHKFPHLPAVA
jgi:hypothetical protein